MLAFVAITSQGLTLLLDDPRDSAEAQYVMDEGPLWMSWSPDSKHRLVHRRAERFLVSTMDGAKVERLDIHSARYRVPAWRPNDQAATFATVSSTSDVALVTAEIAETVLGVQQSILDVSENPAFLWSPDSRFLAVVDSFRVTAYQGGVMLVYSKLTVLSVDKDVPSVAINDDVVAYFWSPYGTKLAYAVRSDIGAPCDGCCWT